METAECLDVAKSKGRPKTGRRDVTAKIDSEVISKAKMVAGARNVSLAEFLTEMLRGPVDRELEKEMRKLAGKKGGEL